MKTKFSEHLEQKLIDDVSKMQSEMLEKYLDESKIHVESEFDKFMKTIDKPQKPIKKKAKKVAKKAPKFKMGKTSIQPVSSSKIAASPGLDCGCDLCKPTYGNYAAKYITPESQYSFDAWSTNPLIAKTPGSSETFGAQNYDKISRKDLIGVIRELMEELGRTTVEIKPAGTSFINGDTVINNNGRQRFLSFRGLIDDQED